MRLDRRTFLRSAGVAMALPLFDAMGRGRTRAAEPGGVPRRMVCINTPLGVHPPYFFPNKTGQDYELSPYLEVLEDFRNDFTVGETSGDRLLAATQRFGCALHEVVQTHPVTGRKALFVSNESSARYALTNASCAASAASSSSRTMRYAARNANSS